MNTGLILFLIFLALSIIDSVARTRRSRQVAPPPEEDGDGPAGGLSLEAGKQAAAKKARGSGHEFQDLEKLMGSGYLERLMGPGFPESPEEEASPEPDAAPVAPPEAESVSPRGRDQRVFARERRTPDQERRRAEARRPSRVDQSRADRRLRDRKDAGSRPARVERETTALRDSAVDRKRDRPVPTPAGAPGFEGRARRRTRLYRELFGGGGRNSLRRAFVLKEILDAPASERPPDQGERS